MGNRLFILLLTAVILVANSGFNVNAAVINNEALKLIGRQSQPATGRCEGYFDFIHKSSTFTDTIPKDSINTHLVIECNVKGVIITISEYALWKEINGKFVDMQGVGLTSLALTGKSKNPGWIITGRYSLHASPSECYNAPIGLPVAAIACANFDFPSGYTEIPTPNQCAAHSNILIGCPPSSSTTMTPTSTL